MTRHFEIPEPRNSSLTNVTPLHPRIPRISLRHPSLRTDLFDQEDPDLAAASECVMLTKIEAQAIAGVLRHARGHCPSPKACDDAIELLMGKR
jgi:hypothetical protein